MKPSLDHIATWYKTEGFYSKLVELGFDVIAPYIKGSRILEIGPADGAMTTLIAKNHVSLTCVEPAAEYVHNLHKRFPNITVKQSTVEKFISKKPFDTIIMAHVLEHIRYPITALRHIKTLMHAKSSLIIVVPNAHSLHRQLGTAMGIIKDPHELTEYDKQLGHYRNYDMLHLKRHIYRSGLTIKKSGGIMIKPLSNKQMEQFDLSIIKGLYTLGHKFPLLSAEVFAVCGI